jgi:putative Mg2+ transporter-C (MgtC) family protein
VNLETQLELSLRLIAAAILSGVVGINRERYDHPAGLRTHMLVGIGSALFTILSTFAFPNGDSGRIASQIVVGIGFLGAGSIIQSSRRIRGMTTAAGIWTVAAIGMACGTGHYLLAAITALLIWFILSMVGKFEKIIAPPRKPGNKESDQESGDQEQYDVIKRKVTADKVTGFRAID